VSRKPKIPPEEKIAAVEAYLHGELGTTEAVQNIKLVRQHGVLGGCYTQLADLKG